MNTFPIIWKTVFFWGTQDNDTEIKMSFRAVISFHYYLLSGLHGTQELYMDQDPFWTFRQFERYPSVSFFFLIAALRKDGCTYGLTESLQ